MRSRTETLATFSTFIQFTGDRFDTWVSDPRLVKSMQQQLQQQGGHERSEKFWVLHWYRRRRQHPYADQHLWAYLQEPCYWAAHRISHRFPMVQYSLADGFQSAIANVDRILNGYNPDYGSDLKAYARRAFGNCIRDQLRQQQEINISSDWGLLRRVSRTQLKRALLATGFVQTSGSILLWQCFKHVCTPELGQSVRGLFAPNSDQLDAIVQRYNRLRHRDLDIPSVDIGTEQLTVELTQLATIVRAYLTPTVTSLNQPQYDDSGEEQLDTLPTDDTPMAQLLTVEAYAEQQRWMQQIDTVLSNKIKSLDVPSQTLLRLYYQQKLTQIDIAHHLNTQQYQVSRKLTRIRRQLLLSILDWSKETLHISTEATVLANVSDVIHEWLQRHYAPEPPEVLE